MSQYLQNLNEEVSPPGLSPEDTAIDHDLSLFENANFIDWDGGAQSRLDFQPPAEADANPQMALSVDGTAGGLGMDFSLTGGKPRSISFVESLALDTPLLLQPAPLFIPAPTEWVVGGRNVARLARPARDGQPRRNRASRQRGCRTCFTPSQKALVICIRQLADAGFSGFVLAAASAFANEPVIAQSWCHTP